jgi:glyoxylase-like metal-dependent hydrolase (beta-lactamase superfamily II)
MPDAEWIVDGTEPIRLAPDFLAIPVPGHTPGSMVLLYRDTFLFTGDHLCWSRENQALYAFRRHCWYSWEVQIQSMERLMTYDFEWILPGHGQRIQLAPGALETLKPQLIQWMRSKA